MKTMVKEYSEGGKIFEAYIALDEDNKSPRPAVCIFPAWNGRDDFAEDKARALSELGYIGMAMDVYGKGVKAKEPSECSRLMEPLMHDRHLLQRRLTAGFEMVRSLEFVDEHRIGAMGFCFGGLCALDLARSGADIKGAVSFHGLLTPPQGGALPVKAKVLALHGYDDPMVPPSDVLCFADEMTCKRVDWQLHAFGLTMHAFTNPLACAKELGLLYSASAEKRSWGLMKEFFTEVFSF